ncbi:MAG: hypothetical protein NZ888_05110 [Candidatus Nitrosocaldus sp.]|nr:hypothetical protein [Candidatus Nitrosocaldus sp.]MDW8000335.1 hypothetical protein [Candidatus Nitrosocaldus sp.]
MEHLLDLTHEHNSNCNHVSMVSGYLNTLREIDRVTQGRVRSEIDAIVSHLLEYEAVTFYREDISLSILSRIRRIRVYESDVERYQHIIRLATEINRGVIVEVVPNVQGGSNGADSSTDSDEGGYEEVDVDDNVDIVEVSIVT